MSVKVGINGFGRIGRITFRALAARANYLAADRSDLMYSTKEICRHMATPTAGGLKKLKRLGRYLLGNGRLITRYDWQDDLQDIAGYSDSDRAGGRVTGKSTSGGVTMLGSHMIKSWATTQGVIALSSGEAEYYGIVKGASVALGLRNMLDDLGMKVKIRVKTDASAAKGIASRRGAGKVRHIEVSQLWVQDKVASGEVVLQKVSMRDNIADALTKNVSSDILYKHMESTCQYIERGRHELMPEVAKQEIVNDDDDDE